MALTKRELFQKRRQRVRNKQRKMANGRPRLSVHRSNKNISVQLIDDAQGVTLAAASTLEKDLGVVGKNNSQRNRKPGVVGPHNALLFDPPQDPRSEIQHELGELKDDE